MNTVAGCALRHTESVQGDGETFTHLLIITPYTVIYRYPVTDQTAVFVIYLYVRMRYLLSGKAVSDTPVDV